MEKIQKQIIEEVVKFFELRFPEKDIASEMKCGYFWEWCNRWSCHDPRIYMDKESLNAYMLITE